MESIRRERAAISVLIAHCDPFISAGLGATLQEQALRVITGVGNQPDNHASSADVAIADYETGLRLLSSPEVRARRIIILTHRDSPNNICYALEQGAWGYLLSGCSVADLVDGIRSVHGGVRALGPLVASRVVERMTLPVLTTRESEVLRQILLGFSNKRIAAELSLSVGTVKTYVKSILAKFNAMSRTHAAALARRYSILPEDPSLPV